MAALVQTGKYGNNNKTYTTNIENYVIKFVSKIYTLQEEKHVMDKSVLLVSNLSKNNT